MIAPQRSSPRGNFDGFPLSLRLRGRASSFCCKKCPLKDVRHPTPTREGRFGGGTSAGALFFPHPLPRRAESRAFPRHYSSWILSRVLRSGDYCSSQSVVAGSVACHGCRKCKPASPQTQGATGQSLGQHMLFTFLFFFFARNHCRKLTPSHTTTACFTCYRWLVLSLTLTVAGYHASDAGLSFFNCARLEAGEA